MFNGRPKYTRPISMDEIPIYTSHHPKTNPSNVEKPNPNQESDSKILQNVIKLNEMIEKYNNQSSKPMSESFIQSLERQFEKFETEAINEKINNPNLTSEIERLRNNILLLSKK